MKIQLKSIEEEAADCRAAWKGAKVGAMAWHCHHEALFEALTEPAESRIRYILSSKPKNEQGLRLRLFRPAGAQLAPLYADYKAKRAPLYADYKAKRHTLYADYDAKRDTLYADYDAKRDTLYADYQAKLASLYADYKAKFASLYADYKAKCHTLYADYQAKLASLHKAECDPDCPWNGHTIFPD